MKKLLTILSFATILVLSGCTVSESMSLKGSKAESETYIEVYDFFAEVLTDQADLLTGEETDVVDNTVRDFTGKLSSSGSADNVKLRMDGKNKYTLNFDFKEIGDVIAALAGGNREQSIIKETDDSIEFYLSLENYGDLEEAIPFLKDPNFEVYGPRENQGMSAEDYYDMMGYILGEDAPEAIADSVISIDIKTPGKIASYSGCIKTGSNSIRYEMRLIDFLLMAEPLSFSVKW